MISAMAVPANPPRFSMTHRTTSSVWVATMVFTLCVLQTSLGAAQTHFVRQSAQTQLDFLGYVEDEFIVVLDAPTRSAIQVRSSPVDKPAVNLPGLQRLLDTYAVSRFRRQFPSARPEPTTSGRPDLTGHYKVRLASGADLDAALQAFRNQPGVEKVERIGIHAVSVTPNDPYYMNSPNPQFPYDQWHYWDTYGIDADLAWNSTSGSSDVVVAILDSGVRYFHSDLGGASPQWGPDNPFPDGNIFINSGETPADGQDNDGNGFVDDTIGWDFVDGAGGGPVTCIDGDCNTVDNDPDDFNGHGTHVAGTVGAITNNNVVGAGVAGGFAAGTAASVANGVRILPLRIGFHARFQGLTGGIVQMDWAAEAMAYVATLVDAGVNITAINCSWGSSNSGGIDAAVDALLARDVMIMHAAGNSNANSPGYLGGKAGVMNVAATDQTGAGASFSNYGSWVDVAAPGVAILSTFRNPDDPDPTHHYLALLDGTSMSSPHVAGIAALLESCNPGLTATDKFNLIVNNTRPYFDVRDLGSGIANANDALSAATCACDLTASFSASPDSGCSPLSVTFTDLSTGTGISNWTWDFGDGNGSSLPNPMHDYTAPGSYDVTLIVDDGSCADTLTVSDAVVVHFPPVAAFSAAPDSGIAPMSVDFTDQSTGNPLAWSWDFGDGESSTQQNPTHEYTAEGLYSVSLVVVGDCGVDSLVQADLIEVTSTATAVLGDDFSGGLRAWASPNPFRGSTRIFLRLERSTAVELVVYNVAGRAVRTLVSRRFDAGIHPIPFDARDGSGSRLTSGIYFYRLTLDQEVHTGKLILSR